MKRTVFYSVTLALMLAVVSSCDYFRKGNAVETVNEVVTNDQYRDSTLYGICGRATSMNSLQLLTDMGDTLVMSLVDAQDAKQVFGGIKVGDQLAVVPNADSTEARIVINMTGLLGDWVMEDPIDGSGEVGISIKDGGAAESINQTVIQYQSWRIINGQLEVVNTRDDGGDFEERGLYKLLFIGPDSLAYEELTKQENQYREDRFEYNRQKPKQNADLGFELEESNFEDFAF